ncbi:hypothetical protein VTK56DRAFT_4131 [Thermocarpiscus australiensis]
MFVGRQQAGEAWTDLLRWCPGRVVIGADGCLRRRRGRWWMLLSSTPTYTVSTQRRVRKSGNRPLRERLRRCSRGLRIPEAATPQLYYTPFLMSLNKI